jgi:hypothetical protein
MPTELGDRGVQHAVLLAVHRWRSPLYCNSETPLHYQERALALFRAARFTHCSFRTPPYLWNYKTIARTRTARKSRCPRSRRQWGSQHPLSVSRKLCIRYPLRYGRILLGFCKYRSGAAMQNSIRVSIRLLRHAERFGNDTPSLPISGIVEFDAIIRSLPNGEVACSSRRCVPAVGHTLP